MICALKAMERTKDKRQKPSEAPRKEARERPGTATKHQPDRRGPNEPQVPQPDPGVAPGITG